MSIYNLNFQRILHLQLSTGKIQLTVYATTFDLELDALLGSELGTALGTELGALLGSEVGLVISNWN
mgnify:CR=1 FL=1